MEKVYLKDSWGLKIGGVLAEPKITQASKVTILAHGLCSSKESDTSLELERRLNEIGIATFRFDFFGHGESEGEFEDLTVSRGVDDILASIDYLKKRGFREIGLVGSSFGGICSIIAASKTSDLKFLGLKCPVSYLAELREDRNDPELSRLKDSFFEDGKAQNGYTAAEKIKIPVFIVHGDKDTVVPIEQSRKISKIFSDCKLIEIKGAGHRFEGEFEEMIEEIVKNVELRM